MSEQDSSGQSAATPEVEYRAIDGYPTYRVGDDGSVWSLKRGVEWRRLKPARATNGYLFVGLSRNGRQRHILVHKLVLTAFKCPRPSGMECAHENGNQLDNRACNLSWKTRGENLADMVTHGTRVRGENVGSASLKNSEVMKIKDALESTDLPCAEIAKKFGVKYGVVLGILSGKAWASVTGGAVTRSHRVRYAQSRCCKLKEEQVREIRLAAAAGARHSHLARKYGINHITLVRVVRGESWQSAGGPIQTERRKPGRPPKNQLRA
jgi:hypothetical protein